MIFLLSWWWLWSAAAAGNSIPGPAQDCEVLRMKCAFRSNCAKSLHSYMVDCADVLSGRTTRCPWACKRALISLTSHEIGLALANCECGDNEFCKKSKERAEVCRPEVSHATADDTIVACSVAEWICAADPLCSTALEYYHRLCRSMFHGRKCTPRCNNSLNILGRQEKAAKLRNCYCDGSEDFDCLNIQQNTQRLCYGNDEWVVETHHLTPTTLTPDSSNGRTVKPCWCLMCVLSCVLVLWTFRTWGVIVDYRGSSRNCRTDVNNKLAWTPSRRSTSSHFRLWPWWWTSERTIKFGS